MRGNEGPTQVRGVPRDCFGNWLLGYSSFLRSCSSFEAELWKVFKGLLRPGGWEFVHRLKVNYDSVKVV